MAVSNKCSSFDKMFNQIKEKLPRVGDRYLRLHQFAKPKDQTSWDYLNQNGSITKTHIDHFFFLNIQSAPESENNKDLIEKMKKYYSQDFKSLNQEKVERPESNAKIENYFKPAKPVTKRTELQRNESEDDVVEIVPQPQQQRVEKKEENPQRIHKKRRTADTNESQPAYTRTTLFIDVPVDSINTWETVREVLSGKKLYEVAPKFVPDMTPFEHRVIRLQGLFGLRSVLLDEKREDKEYFNACDVERLAEMFDKAGAPHFAALIRSAYVECRNMPFSLKRHTEEEVLF